MHERLEASLAPRAAVVPAPVRQGLGQGGLDRVVRVDVVLDALNRAEESRVAAGRSGVIGAYLNPEIPERLRRLADKLGQVAVSDALPRRSERSDRQLPGGIVPRVIRQARRSSGQVVRLGRGQ